MKPSSSCGAPPRGGEGVGEVWGNSGKRVVQVQGQQAAQALRIHCFRLSMFLTGSRALPLKEGLTH